MRVIYCWRCDEDVPMLDEEEFAEVQAVYDTCVTNVKNYREKHDVSLEQTPLETLYQPVQQKYRELTGATGYSVDAILKHRISLYGSPCRQCGKPLRTPQAKLCAACGTPVN